MIPCRPRTVGRLAALVAVAFLVASAPADILLLAGGKAVEGEAADRGETYEVKTKYGTLAIKKSDVRRILKGREAAAPAPPAELVPPTVQEKPPAPPVAELAPPSAPPGAKPAISEAEAQKFIEELFGTELKRAAASADGKDDAALAKQLLQTAKTIEDQPVVSALLYEKAIELGAKHPEALTDSECLEVGDWYRALAEGAAKGSKSTLYNRAHDWFARYRPIHAGLRRDHAQLVGPTGVTGSGNAGGATDSGRKRSPFDNSRAATVRGSPDPSSHGAGVASNSSFSSGFPRSRRLP
jgi:hypothetical protein